LRIDVLSARSGLLGRGLSYRGLDYGFGRGWRLGYRGRSFGRRWRSIGSFDNAIGYGGNSFGDDTVGAIDVNRSWSTGSAERRRAGLAHQHTGNPNVLGGERQKRELSRPLEGNIQRALVGCAGARLATWLNLAAL
jgi:hypothetical protein